MARVLPKVLKAGAKVGASFLQNFINRRGMAVGFQNYELQPLGIVGQALQGNISKQNVDPIPVLDRPQRVNGQSNPTFETISKQLDDLGKLADSIGLLTKKQQETLVNRIKESNRAAREANLEAKRPEKVDQLSSESLRPLSDAVAELAKTLGLLTEVVDEKHDEVGGGRQSFLQNFFNRRGYGMYYEEWSQSRAAKRKAREEAKRFSKTIEGRASKFSPEDFLDKNGKPLNRSQIPMRLGKLEDAARARTLSGRVSKAFKVGGSKAIKSIAGSSVQKSFSKALSAGVGKAAKRSSEAKGVIRKIAGPLISKALGSTALKSIPIVGAVAGLGFAASRLADGDVVGAGLDAASGLGGPLTAIPALIASIARDVYSDVYGIQPERDANFSKRIDEVTSTVKQLVMEYIKPKVKPADSPTSAKVDQKLTASKLTANPSSSNANLPPAPKPPAQPAGGGGEKSASPSHSKPVPSPNVSNPVAKSTTSGPKPSAGVGKELSSASPGMSQGTNLLAAQIKQEQSISVMSIGDRPQLGSSTKPTSKPGAKGVGDVPNPNYAHNLGGQLYFSYQAGGNA